MASRIWPDTFCGLHVCGHLLGELQDLVSISENFLSFFRQNDRVVDAVEQARIQFGFQLPDLK